MARDLSRLLRPQSIAVLGGTWAESVIVQCQRMGYQGDLWAVNPRRDTLSGVPCFRTLQDLPSAPDAAFIGINRQATVAAMKELSAMGGGGAVCFASGFAESGELDLQQQLVEAANDMPFLGPNCYGIINFLDGALLWPDQHGGRRCESGAAIITQSSNILINLSSQKRGLPIAYLAAAGNQAQTTMAELAHGFLEDDRVRAIGFYIEGIADAQEFAEFAAKAEERGIPLAAIKAGKCDSSQAAAQTHTAALTGGGEASSAFLRQCNIAEATELSELIEMLKFMQLGSTLRGRKIMSLSCSGGEAGHVADLAIQHNLEFSPPTTTQKTKLESILGELVSITNPLDYHTFIWHDEEALYQTYSAALQGDNDLTILIYDYPRKDRCDLQDWQMPMKSFIRAVKDCHCLAAVVATLPENMPEEVAAQLWSANIAPMCGLSDSLSAFAAVANWRTNTIGQWRPLSPPSPNNAQNISKTLMLNEADAKQLLKKNGITVPNGQQIQTPEDATAIAKNNGKKTYAIKSLNLAHKTDVGGVRLHVVAADISSTIKTMPSTHGFLIEEMIENPCAELLLSACRDAVYGATLTIGMGGIHAEILNDTQTLILPLTKADVIAAIHRLRLSPLLLGTRGQRVADIAAAADIAIDIAHLLETQPAIADIEINPLILKEAGKGAIVADALIYMENLDNTRQAQQPTQTGGKTDD